MPDLGTLAILLALAPHRPAEYEPEDVELEPTPSDPNHFDYLPEPDFDPGIEAVRQELVSVRRKVADLIGSQGYGSRTRERTASELLDSTRKTHGGDERVATYLETLALNVPLYLNEESEAREQRAHAHEVNEERLDWAWRQAWAAKAIVEAAKLVDVLQQASRGATETAVTRAISERRA